MVIQHFYTSPDMGLELMNQVIMTWNEVGHLTDWASQVPLKPHFKNPCIGHLKNIDSVSYADILDVDTLYDIKKSHLLTPLTH